MNNGFYNKACKLKEVEGKALHKTRCSYGKARMHTKTYLNITKSANLKGVEAGERHCTNPAFARQSTHKIINSSACNFTVKPSNTKRAYGKLGKT